MAIIHESKSDIGLDENAGRGPGCTFGIGDAPRRNVQQHFRRAWTTKQNARVHGNGFGHCRGRTRHCDAVHQTADCAEWGKANLLPDRHPLDRRSDTPLSDNIHLVGFQQTRKTLKKLPFFSNRTLITINCII